MDLSGIGDSDSKLAATNGSKIRTWRLLIRSVQEKRELVVLSSSTLPGRGWHLPLRLGEVRGDRSKKWTLLYICVSTIFQPVSTGTCQFFPKGCFSVVWSLTQEMCIFPGRPKSLWFVSGDHTSCTSIKVLTSPGFGKQLSLCETLLQL